MNSAEFKLFMVEQRKTIGEMAEILGFSKSFIGKISSANKEISKNVIKQIKAKFPDVDISRFL